MVLRRAKALDVLAALIVGVPHPRSISTGLAILPTVTTALATHGHGRGQELWPLKPSYDHDSVFVPPEETLPSIAPTDIYVPDYDPAEGTEDDEGASHDRKRVWLPGRTDEEEEKRVYLPPPKVDLPAPKVGVIPVPKVDGQVVDEVDVRDEEAGPAPASCPNIAGEYRIMDGDGSESMLILQNNCTAHVALSNGVFIGEVVDAGNLRFERRSYNEKKGVRVHRLVGMRMDNGDLTLNGVQCKKSAAKSPEAPRLDDCRKIEGSYYAERPTYVIESFTVLQSVCDVQFLSSSNVSAEGRVYRSSITLNGAAGTVTGRVLEGGDLLMENMHLKKDVGAGTDAAAPAGPPAQGNDQPV